MSEHRDLIVEQLRRLLALAEEGRVRGVALVSLTDTTVEWQALACDGGILARMEMCKGLSMLEEELTDQIYDVACGEDEPQPVLTPANTMAH